MLIIKHTLETKASAQAIWNMWQDVESWNTWDHDLESSAINGSFQTGTSGHLKFKDSPLLKTILTHVEPFKIFVQEAELPLAKSIMTHIISQDSGKTQVTIKNEIRGFLAPFYALLLGSSIKKKIPVEMEMMIKKAESLSKI